MKNTFIFGWLTILTLLFLFGWYRQNLIIQNCDDNAMMVMRFVELYGVHK